MAKAKKSAKKEVSRVEVKGATIVTFDDGSMQIIPAVIELTEEEVSNIFGEEEDEEEEDEEDDSEDEEDDESEDEEEEDEEEEDDEEEESELTGEQLAEMDFEELEDLCEDQDLETDPDDFDEDDIEKLRKAIAKEMGIALPKAKEAKKSKKGKK